MSETLNFVYINGSAQIKAYSVVNINKKDDDFFNAYSLNKERVLTFRYDRIVKTLSSFEDAELFIQQLSEDDINAIKNTIFTESQLKKITRPASSVKKAGLSCCFTGFRKADKERLIALADKHDIRTVGGISSITDFLIVCEESKTIGKLKLQKAEQFGVTVMFEDEFYYFLDTGALPENVDNQGGMV